IIFYQSSDIFFFKINTYDFNHHLLFFVPRFKFGYHLYTLLPYIVYTFSSATSIKPVGVSIILYSKKRQSSSIPPNSSLSISVPNINTSSILDSKHSFSSSLLSKQEKSH